MNFIEPDGRFVPELTQPAIPAIVNSVLVAHPIDLARMNTMALFSRRELRGYLDIGTFADREPDLLLSAVHLIKALKTINERHLLMALASPPEDVLGSIPDEILAALTSFVNKAFQSISKRGEE